MKKKPICLLLILSVLLLCTSCGGTENTKNSSSESPQKVSTEDEAYPSPKITNWEPSPNSTGARYNMNLKEYTDAFNEMYNSLGGGSEAIDYAQWKKMKSGEKDEESGMIYDYYYYADDKAVLTATVEQESGKIMNLGCGTTVSVFVDKTTADYQTIILTMTGIMASVAGGYTVDNVTFFADLFIDTISNTNNSFWYNNGIYLLNIEEGETDADSTMLFRVVPAVDALEEEWDLIDYKDFCLEQEYNGKQTSKPDAENITEKEILSSVPHAN